MLFTQHCLLSCIVCSQILYLFCISKHAQQGPLRMEVFKRKENPRRFMRIFETRKCYHVRAEFISASGVIQSCATALTEEREANPMSQHCLVHGLENNHTQILCVRSQHWSCSAFLASVLSFFLSSPFPQQKAISLKLDFL